MHIIQNAYIFLEKNIKFLFLNRNLISKKKLRLDLAFVHACKHHGKHRYILRPEKKLKTKQEIYFVQSLKYILFLKGYIKTDWFAFNNIEVLQLKNGTFFLNGQKF